MNGEIHKIEAVNSLIDRIYLNNDEIVCEIHKKLLECNVGEKLKINISDQVIKSPSYLVNGQIYYTANNSVCVSCGGLLYKLPHFQSSSLGKNIYINVAKVGKRGRPPSNTSTKKTKS